jgi:hypothetical protein
MIPNFDIHLEKREVQKMLIPLIKKRKLITLAGPNIVSYLSMYPPSFKHVEVWERNRKVMIRQVAQLGNIRGRSITYRFGDIINAKVDRTAFYDLDFCATIKTTAPYLEKFRDCAFSATFSNWWSSIESTITKFLDAVGETKVLDIPHPQFNLLKTNKNNYLYTTHVDTTNMTTIFKFH